MKIQTKKIDKWKAFVYTETNDGNIMISYCGKGGAIVSGKTFEEAKNKFIEAMNFCESLVKLFNFNNYGKLVTEHLEVTSIRCGSKD